MQARPVHGITIAVTTGMDTWGSHHLAILAPDIDTGSQLAGAIAYAERGIIREVEVQATAAGAQSCGRRQWNDSIEDIKRAATIRKSACARWWHPSPQSV
jgi:hypothetical protein